MVPTFGGRRMRRRDFIGAIGGTLAAWPEVMLWTAPPPARECQGYGGRLRLPRFGGAIYAVDFDNRSRYRQVGLSSAWRGCGWPSGPTPAVEGSARLGIFPKTVAVPGGYRGVRLIAPLVPRAAGAGAYGAADAAGLCEALRQAAEERHYGRRGDLRSGHKAEHAVRADQDGRATELSDASSSAPSLHPPADCGHQLNPRLPCRVRDRGPGRAQGRRATSGGRR